MVLPANVKFLIILLLADLITGIIKSLYGNSDKSENGLLSSKAMTKGIFTKICYFFVILVAYYIDTTLSLKGFLYNYVIVYFCIESSLSILENVACCGVKVPSIVKNKLDILERKNDNV